MNQLRKETHAFYVKRGPRRTKSWGEDPTDMPEMISVYVWDPEKQKHVSKLVNAREYYEM